MRESELQPQFKSDWFQRKMDNRIGVFGDAARFDLLMQPTEVVNACLSFGCYYQGGFADSTFA